MPTATSTACGRPRPDFFQEAKKDAAHAASFFNCGKSGRAAFSPRLRPAARRAWGPATRNPHTCGAQGGFVHVHAPAENRSDRFAPAIANFRNLFNKLKGHRTCGVLLFLPGGTTEVSACGTTSSPALRGPDQVHLCQSPGPEAQGPIKTKTPRPKAWWFLASAVYRSLGLRPRSP